MATGTESRGDGLNNDQKLCLLRELARALSRLGVGAKVLDEPGLTVSTPNPGIHIRVSIESATRLFTWRAGQNIAAWRESSGSHPVEDAEGAAVEIAKCANRHNGVANGGVRS